jgi:hypothetical protein
MTKRRGFVARKGRLPKERVFAEGKGFSSLPEKSVL